MTFFTDTIVFSEYYDEKNGGIHLYWNRWMVLLFEERKLKFYKEETISFNRQQAWLEIEFKDITKVLINNATSLIGCDIPFSG